MLITHLVELIKYRELIGAFTLREIKVRYKQTILGSAWAILQPLALTIIFTLVFEIFLKVKSVGVPYPIFAYSALLPWTFFTTAVSFGSLSIVNNSSLVTKIFFPRETLPISSIIAAFLFFFFAGIIFIFMLFYYRVVPTYSLLFLFILLPAIISFTLGITLFLAALNVIFRDIKFVTPLLLQLWLYISPVIYSIENVPKNIRFFYALNPMAPFIESFRDITVLGKMPNLNELTIATLISVLVLLFAFLFFKSKEKKFADII